MNFSVVPAPSTGCEQRQVPAFLPASSLVSTHPVSGRGYSLLAPGLPTARGH